MNLSDRLEFKNLELEVLGLVLTQKGFFKWWVFFLMVFMSEPHLECQNQYGRLTSGLRKAHSSIGDSFKRRSYMNFRVTRPLFYVIF